ncbi:MAG: hypothetical protein RL757_918 [Bacteroidota bacterium]|jgi:UPF0176 protein
MKNLKPRLHNRVNREVLKQRALDSHETRKTVSFYRYHQIADVPKFRDKLYQLLQEVGVFGRIYVASEGINAQISVAESNFDAFQNRLYSIDWLDGVRLNVAVEEKNNSFYLLKVKIRPKIVADGLEDQTFDVTQRGKHVGAKEFNELVSDPNSIVIDFRNHYESEVGRFDHAVTPEVETFRESLPLIEEFLHQQNAFGDDQKNLVMYCTGGIRCEKASAYFRHKGFKNVFQLDGGIINYAKQVEAEGLENKFRGVNFVFDERLGERISDDVVANCHQCGQPADVHINCANAACHLLFIQCDACREKYESCCSNKCKNFNHLSEAERETLKPNLVFNGSKRGENRHKSHRGTRLIDVN